ncbi:hypothetical protein N7491_001938 [Penicillium cf. griseofulvum]|uniref:Uncharacterized protein n=1 Tax=Penicillium cf. griseofulvum TaxID=2972120 RepID=A0A9W9MTV3_9EURO|nr:hypothetical protein N7472_003880 [Penicillium cf. griseofulvum]KAJ5445856.1 hypothetical protein N7491_001938 [Penicillium cf. griseofulvum]KAJ5447576.1 hypothetical protein N7445_002397 [Penicillium cf. griseofulvum]
MSERVPRNFGLFAMTADGKVTSLTNPKYNNSNSNLRTNTLLVSINCIDLELDTKFIPVNMDIVDFPSTLESLNTPTQNGAAVLILFPNSLGTQPRQSAYSGWMPKTHPYVY